jgi:hypothetical protein
MKHLAGEGKLVTRDGRYRRGRYDIRANDAPGLEPTVEGAFHLAAGEERPGVPEEFFGAATLILEGGEEIDVTLAGTHEHRVHLAGPASLITGRPGPHGRRP